ncbi:metallopeptidase domain-containing protein [Plantactinospora soyae]|uniref:M6 family metalloprotease-like protein n=1 Tax=Plantactinospora soyae TaxID=1544732 RepID=A0A927RBG0_9ACTN|nr:peptidase M6 [Plantactinospora soyae]MBE1491656.1 M6 family metalloprotease-like protein [Plantactinospora soyae]
MRRLIRRNQLRRAYVTCVAALAATALLTGPGTASVQAGPAAGPLGPVDPQYWQDQETMTWDDYRAVPGGNWADPARQPSQRKLRIALVAADNPDQPFVITQPRASDPFRNPQVAPVARADVAKFYADFWGTPSALNHGHTVHEYWMEQTNGRVGVEFTPFGPYRLPRPQFEYGLNDIGQERAGCPAGHTCDGNLDRDVDALWQAAEGADVRSRFDLVLRVYAGYDETSVWQEFGEMMFQTREDVPDAWGPPDPNLPNWVRSRYVDWTSWKAGAQLWGSSSMRQGESSGTITHEIAHTFGIADNNNNPYVSPYRRVGSGTWDVMDRGSFNGPGGPHNRWVVPASQGAAMPAGQTLRSKLKLGHIDEAQVVRLSREALRTTGLAVITVKARSAVPGARDVQGVRIGMDRDLTPACDINADPLCPGSPAYDFYSLETVQRIGADSFTPDNGVLIAKNKTAETSTCGYTCFTWVVDANPQDIDMVDYYKPDGTPVKRTVADYRQLNDALFHAGTRSGSEDEYVDEANRLHFYVLDRSVDAAGLLSYTLGVRHLDGAGPSQRGVAVAQPAGGPTGNPTGAGATCTFTLTNTGRYSAGGQAHPEDVSAYLKSDVYRLSAAVNGRGWTVVLPTELTSAAFGRSVPVKAVATASGSSTASGRITLTARSESDPSRTATATCRVDR